MNEQIGNKINDKTYIKLTPFKGFVLENFPFIEADFDAITNYQLLCKVIEYLNNVISNQNTVQELGTDLVNAYNSLVDAVNLAINEFETDVTADINQFKVDINNDFDEFTSNITTQFNNLQNYVDNFFDNNFPQMISDKLDEMASDGTLENLLNDSTHLTKSYNTYTEMIADSSSFTNGLRLKTSGYYTINDGGGADYYVNNSVIESNYQIDLQNGLYLNLINPQNVNQFGAYGDGTHDDSSAFQNAINTCNVIKLLDKTYLLSNSIVIDSAETISIIGLNNATIKINSNIYAFTFESVKNKTIKNINFDIDSGGILQATNTNTNTEADFNIINVKGNITNSNNDIVKIYHTHLVKIENCYFKNNSSNNTPSCIVLDGVVNANIVKNSVLYFDNGIKIINSSTYTNEGVIISENLLYQNNNQIINNTTNSLLFFDINNNIIDFCETNGIKLQNIESSTISDNYFGINNENCNPLYIRQINYQHTDLSIINNKFVNYNQTMVEPTIKINNSGDQRETGLKIIGNHATIYKTFIELNNTAYCSISDNSCVTGVNGNKFVDGDSVTSCKFSNNLNAGNPLYTNSRQENLNISPDDVNVKNDITHDTFYKPTNSNGFYLNITFANATTSDQLVNLYISKDGVTSILAGNTTVRASGLAFVNMYIPSGYFIKYNTTTPANIVVNSAHAIY